MNNYSTIGKNEGPHCLADLVPAGMFVGTSLILCHGGRFLYGLREPRPEGERLVAELTGIGGGVEAEDETIAAGALREGQEEMGCAVRLLPAAETVIVHGPGRLDRLALVGSEPPAAVVFRRYRTPPHQPWHERNQGEACLVVYLAELAGPPRPAMELPALIWLTPAQLVETARRDVPLATLLARGAELLADHTRPLPGGLWLRLTDSQEALVLALAEDAQPFYEALAVC
ncbi:MAG TPA: hypothetical protein PLJ35_19880 [Anaerolineae bacterium]|nr:hypothetical protein [Anaerolineae bacterium]HPL30345.1 hypothetical protein [Anaerolineae bacterium]